MGKLKSLGNHGLKKPVKTTSWQHDLVTNVREWKVIWGFEIQPPATLIFYLWTSSSAFHRTWFFTLHPPPEPLLPTHPVSRAWAIVSSFSSVVANCISNWYALVHCIPSRSSASLELLVSRGICVMSALGLSESWVISLHGAGRLVGPVATWTFSELSDKWETLFSPLAHGNISIEFSTGLTGVGSEHGTGVLLSRQFLSTWSLFGAW
jgi:hypothetical protein